MDSFLLLRFRLDCAGTDRFSDRTFYAPQRKICVFSIPYIVSRQRLYLKIQVGKFAQTSVFYVDKGAYKW